MILQNKYRCNHNYLTEDKINKSYYAIFFKNLYLHIFKNRLLINANYKFNILINILKLAWSNRINEKAYVNRRRIFRRNTNSSY